MYMYYFQDLIDFKTNLIIIKFKVICFKELQYQMTYLLYNNTMYGMLPGFPACFSHKIPGFVQVKKKLKGHSPGYSADNFGTKRWTTPMAFYICSTKCRK